MELYMGVAITTLVGSGAGSFLGAYLKKKGENLATHEDIDQLVDQVRAVTTTTKEIEAKISNDVWDRQKRWELKRDVLFEAARRLSDMEDALLSLDSVMQIERAKLAQGAESGWREEKVERIDRWRKVSAAFDETRLLVSIVCGKQGQEAFNEYGDFTNVIAAAIVNQDAEIYKLSATDLFKKSLAVKTAMRVEIGIDDQPNSIQ